MLTVRLGAVRRLALIALVALPAADAWVTISQSYWGAQLSDIKDQMHPNTSTSVEPVLRLGYLWSEPKNTDIPDGLGGGITWAFDDTLCDEILPEFSEKPFLITFVSCTEIQAAVHRGFAAWSDNSAKLTFIDVTEECRRLGQLNVDCPLAEVFVTHLTQENAASVRLRRQLVAEDALPSAERMSAGGETAALARSFPSYSDSFRSTNGFTPAGLTVETRRATISFNANLCWYLDSTFCSSFHLLKVHLMPLTTRQIAWIVRALLISVWLFAVVGIIWHVLVVVKKAIEHDTHEDEHRAMILAEKEGKLTQTGGLPEESTIAPSAADPSPLCTAPHATRARRCAMRSSRSARAETMYLCVRSEATNHQVTYWHENTHRGSRQSARASAHVRVDAWRRPRRIAHHILLQRLPPVLGMLRLRGGGHPRDRPRPRPEPP